MSVWLLFNTKWVIFQQYHAEGRRVNYIWWDDNDISFVLDQLDTLSWIFIVQAQWNISQWVDIFMILSQPIFTLTPYNCV